MKSMLPVAITAMISALACYTYFHHFSTAVWGLWLVPFVSGMIAAMVHG